MQVKGSNGMDPTVQKLSSSSASVFAADDRVNRRHGIHLGQTQFWSMRYEVEEKILAAAERDFLDGKCNNGRQTN
jgi:hypothetical protein